MVWWWLPGNGFHAVKANEAEVRAQPQIAVRRLRNGANVGLREPVLDFPDGVPVLTDVE